MSASFPLGVTAVMLPELDFQEQVALCRELGVTHYSLRPRVIADDQRDKPFSPWGNHKFDLTPARLIREGAQLKAQLAAAGLVPFGTVPAATVDQPDDALREHFHGAAAVGAGRVRVATPSYPRNERFDYPRKLDETVAHYRRAVALAKPMGLKIVIETHRGSLAASPALAWNICRHFDPSDLGVIFDLANFNGEGGLVPNLAVCVMDPYIDHVHIGGMHAIYSDYDAHGFRKVEFHMSPLTESHLYMPDWIAALGRLGRAIPLVIENFTPNMTGASRLRQTVGDLKRLLETGG